MPLEFALLLADRQRPDLHPLRRPAEDLLLNRFPRRALRDRFRLALASARRARGSANGCTLRSRNSNGGRAMSLAFLPVGGAPGAVGGSTGRSSLKVRPFSSIH
jgi:hypothetical protein